MRLHKSLEQRQCVFRTKCIVPVAKLVIYDILGVRWPVSVEFGGVEKRQDDSKEIGKNESPETNWVVLVSKGKPFLSTQSNNPIDRGHIFWAFFIEKVINLSATFYGGPCWSWSENSVFDVVLTSHDHDQEVHPTTSFCENHNSWIFKRIKNSALVWDSLSRP